MIELLSPTDRAKKADGKMREWLSNGAELGWLIEEFRVQTFAPELKTSVPVSAQRLQALWSRVVG